MSDYTIITSDEDGVRIQQMSKAQLERELANDYWGEDMVWVDRMPDRTDPQEWGSIGSIGVIIRGEIVTPEAETTVTKWVMP
jgi:hypothetical protein